MQLLYEATILGYKLDMNTYLKMIISSYFDYEVKFDRKDFIMHLYILFQNDVDKECFAFCNEFLTEYIDSNFSDEFNFRDNLKNGLKRQEGKK